MSSTSAPHRPSPSPDRPTLTEQLRADWGRLRDQPDLLERVRSWRLPGDVPGEVPGDLDQVLHRAGFGGAADDAAADGYLACMVATAAHDELAARVVLQRILPGLVRIALRRAPTAGGLRAAFDEVAGTAWVVIRTFPVERRPHHVAANLLRDIEYQAFVREHRLAASQREVPVPRHQLPDTPAPDEDEPLLELAAVLVEAVRAGLPPADHDLVRLAVAAGTTAAATARLGIPERTWRARKAAATARLRQLATVVG